MILWINLICDKCKKQSKIGFLTAIMGKAKCPYGCDNGKEEV